MRNKFDRELDKLNGELTEMGELISERIIDAISAFKHKDLEKAKMVLEGDDEVNEMERIIEKRALKLLLQQQPVASDLRLISAALKMITDMERIGDHAADIAEITLSMPKFTKDDTFDTIMQMAALSIEMVKESIKSFVTGDLSLVDNIREHDDKVDAYFNEVKEDVIKEFKSSDTNPEYAVDVLMIAKYLERIGDHAENISEWVEFSITGKHSNN
ncbi:phosphate signaling complex protein PhoU [Miniphocaeibacter halophilus]|uniref:Phosphate signaling complex protein PhoU n=1 Tax=Miniphocaeibacter halophilus TaxID=2931922 RepID=A0AC61MSC6_9FIRM|nr:phosphate signaling complex protein PhoU [Miniphocaeibacter halophilus]QQK08544.1 phosphate signaling complex protein PhoU [Miniphocaeibacter halophilus]